MGVVSQQDVLNAYNASIFYKEIPMEANGYVFYYKGIYCIVINENLSTYKKRKTLLHELAHIELNQLCQYDKDLLEFHRQDYEDEADFYINEIKKNLKEIDNLEKDYEVDKI